MQYVVEAFWKLLKDKNVHYTFKTNPHGCRLHEHGESWIVELEKKRKKLDEVSDSTEKVKLGKEIKKLEVNNADIKKSCCRLLNIICVILII